MARRREFLAAATGGQRPRLPGSTVPVRRPATGRMLPAWVREALRAASSPSREERSRKEPRHSYAHTVFARPAENPVARPVLVKVFNVSLHGIGLIAREPVRDGNRLLLTPDDSDTDPVMVRVVHCTQTIHGYKLGCRFES